MKRLLAGIFALLFLGACQQQGFEKLQVGVSTRQDVLQLMGEPGQVWPLDQGRQKLEYSLQPEGLVNYMLTLGADDVLVAKEQVLTRADFARVKPGMTALQVRALLGQPATQRTYELQQQSIWTWRFMDTGNQRMIFHVSLDAHDQVMNSGVSLDDRDVYAGG